MSPGFYFDKRETKYFHFDKGNHVTFLRGVLCFRNPLRVIESEQSLELLVKSKCLTGKEKSVSVLRLLNLKLENSGCTLYDFGALVVNIDFPAKMNDFSNLPVRSLNNISPAVQASLCQKLGPCNLGDCLL